MKRIMLLTTALAAMLAASKVQSYNQFKLVHGEKYKPTVVCYDSSGKKLGKAMLSNAGKKEHVITGDCLVKLVKVPIRTYSQNGILIELKKDKKTYKSGQDLGYLPINTNLVKTVEVFTKGEFKGNSLYISQQNYTKSGDLYFKIIN